MILDPEDLVKIVQAVREGSEKKLQKSVEGLNIALDAVLTGKIREIAKEVAWEVLNEADQEGFFDSDQSTEPTKE